MRKILILLLMSFMHFAICPKSYSQSAKHWGYGYKIIAFDSNTRVTKYPIDLFNKVSQVSDGINYCSPNGDLIFLGGSLMIYDQNGIPIKNSTQLYIPPNSIMLQTSENSWESIGFHYIDSNYLNKTGQFKFYKEIKSIYCQTYGNCFDSLQFYKFGFYKTEIKRDSLNNGFVNQKMIQSANDLPNRIKFSDVKRVKGFEYQLLGIRQANLNDFYSNQSIGIYSFSYKNSEIKTLDSTIISAYEFIPDSIKYLSKSMGSSLHVKYAHLSRSLDKIFINLEYNILSSFGNFYSIEVLYSIECDPNSGIFKKTPEIEYWNISKNPKIFFSSDTIINYSLYEQNLTPSNSFSSNDSIYYIFKTITYYHKGETKMITQDLIAWNFRNSKLQNSKTIYRLENSNSEHPYKQIYSKNINPYGGLTMVYLDMSDKRNPINTFVHFKNSNKPINYVIQKFKMNDLGYLGTFQNTVIQNYDFIRIDKQIEYKNCRAYFSAENKSDLSNGLKEFTWIISKVPGINSIYWDTFRSFNLPEISVVKSGKYLLKLIGKAKNQNNYEEIYLDTAIINIPIIPHVDFYVSDSIICSKTKALFESKCNTIEKKFETFNWVLGDSSTDTGRIINHLYKISGKFDVTLKYNNGYCEIKLTKPNSIRVLESPENGFKVSSITGCTPFKVQIRDSIQVNLINSKEYYFEDINKWINNVDSNKLTHTFYTPGHFKIKQRLIGKSGCFIQFDSIYVDVFSGFNMTDTIKIINATVEDELVKINWNRKQAAERYQLYSNELLIGNLKDSFFNHDIKYNKPIEYRVIGFDHCNNICESKYNGRPILLTGKIIGNNQSINLSYLNYLKWEDSIINYSIQKWSDNKWQSIYSKINNYSFSDSDISLNGVVFQKYRIEAYNNSNPNIISHSNIIELPLLPVVYIPNAFSPNNDQVNDQFSIYTVGVEFFKITIVNQWGEIQFKGNANESWDGAGAPQGIYTAIIEFITSNKEIKCINTTLHLIK